MRDPYAPIPARGTARYWEQAASRPPPLPPGAESRATPKARQNGATDPTRHEVDSYDPMRLLAPSGDALGIDRRRRTRNGSDTVAVEDDSLRMLDVVGCGHVRVRRVLGLRSTHGSALVEAVSWCPTGVLVRALDPTDPELSSRGRLSAHRAFRSLLPELSMRAPSPLFAAGLAVLSARLVRDLAAWAGAPGAGPGRGRRPRHAVRLIVPCAAELATRTSASSATPSARTGAAALRVDGELAPLTDPGRMGEILAIAIGPEHADALRQALLDPALR